MTLHKKVPLLEKQPAAQESVESAGYWLHNLYSAYEDLFKLVAGFWENSLSLDGELKDYLTAEIAKDAEIKNTLLLQFPA